MCVYIYSISILYPGYWILISTRASHRAPDSPSSADSGTYVKGFGAAFRLSHPGPAFRWPGPARNQILEPLPNPLPTFSAVQFQSAQHFTKKNSSLRPQPYRRRAPDPSGAAPPCTHRRHPSPLRRQVAGCWQSRLARLGLGPRGAGAGTDLGDLVQCRWGQAARHSCGLLGSVEPDEIQPQLSQPWLLQCWWRTGIPFCPPPASSSDIVASCNSPMIQIHMLRHPSPSRLGRHQVFGNYLFPSSFKYGLD